MVHQGTMEGRQMGPVPGYQVKLPLFEGPLDLLLFLIQRDEMDIYDIPIARITEEYLEYLRLMRLLQLNVAADFLVMAATLMSLKSQMLLPHSAQADDFIQEDPGRELANRLLEYRLFKAAAQKLECKEDKTALLYTRPGEFQWAGVEQGQEDLLEVSLYDLLIAFKRIVEKESEVDIHEVALEEITVKERFDYVLNTLARREKVPFVELIRSDPRKTAMVVTFLAILELIRAQLVSVKQQRAFGQIWIYLKTTARGRS